MNSRITDKIEEIEKYLKELKSIVPKEIKDYEEDIKVKAACERYFDKIMEAATDLAFLIIKHENFPAPEDDLAVFIALFEKEIIGKELAYKLKEAKQMRNFIAHRYGFIDDLTVFNSITKELFSDIEHFLQAIKNLK